MFLPFGSVMAQTVYEERNGLPGSLQHASPVEQHLEPPGINNSYRKPDSFSVTNVSQKEPTVG